MKLFHFYKQWIVYWDVNSTVLYKYYIHLSYLILLHYMIHLHPEADLAPLISSSDNDLLLRWMNAQREDSIFSEFHDTTFRCR